MPLAPHDRTHRSGLTPLCKWADASSYPPSPRPVCKALISVTAVRGWRLVLRKLALSKRDRTNEASSPPRHLNRQPAGQSEANGEKETGKRVSGHKSVSSILSFSFHKVCLGTVCCDHKILDVCLEHEHSKGRVRGPGHRQNSRSFTRPHCLWRFLPGAAVCGLFRWSLDVCRYFRQAQKGRLMRAKSRLAWEFTHTARPQSGVSGRQRLCRCRRGSHGGSRREGGWPSRFPSQASAVTGGL